MGCTQTRVFQIAVRSGGGGGGGGGGLEILLGGIFLQGGGFSYDIFL